ncbi:MAG: VWA domain-containing protein [Elusimicrobia bacterium]|nr:VWA domain-containing protein [Elusimicrobiota bacterium]
MKKEAQRLFFAGLFLLFGVSAQAEPLKKLARKLSSGLEELPNTKVAVLNFPYPEGKMSSGSFIVQERLTTFLVERGKLEVIERSLLKKVLEEMNLEMSGALDVETSKKLGKLLGVGALITGTLNDLEKNRTEINARIIETETGKILAAGQTHLERTWSDSPVKPPSVIVQSTDPTPQLDPGDKPKVQIALLLDTSNSMDGLIQQAKTQLWKIVNELASSEKRGHHPLIQVALYEYGNNSLSPGEGYIRQVLPFTIDLDQVSENLFSLTTHGGEEYSGWVIKDALNNLQWDSRQDVYKAIFIAGNEPFTQGPVDFKTTVARATNKGIVVNTIFCGDRQEGISTQWLAGAQIGNGSYFNINQDAQVIWIHAPQDDEIQRLSDELNGTYIPYGTKGKEASLRQKAQDQSARKFPAAGAPVERALFKASAQYASVNAAGWDMVSALESKSLKPEQIQKENLPESLQSLDRKDIQKYAEEKSQERKNIQDKIQKLNEARRKYLDRKEKEMKKLEKESTLDQAMLQAIRTQAAQKNFKFKTN